MMSGNVCKIASILSRVVAIVITPSLSSRTACQHSQQFNNAVTPACGTDWLIVSPRGAKWMVCSVRWQNAVSCHDARWVSRLGGVDTCTVCAHTGKRNCLDIQSAGQRRQLQSSLKSSNLLLWLHQRCLFAYLSTFTFPYLRFLSCTLLHFKMQNRKCENRSPAKSPKTLIRSCWTEELHVHRGEASVSWHSGKWTSSMCTFTGSVQSNKKICNNAIKLFSLCGLIICVITIYLLEVILIW